MLRLGIPVYRLPRNVLEYEISYLDRLGIRFVLNCEIGKDKGVQERLDDNGLENMNCMIAYSCNECSQCTLKCPSLICGATLRP